MGNKILVENNTEEFKEAARRIHTRHFLSEHEEVVRIERMATPCRNAPKSHNYFYLYKVYDLECGAHFIESGPMITLRNMEKFHRSNKHTVTEDYCVCTICGETYIPKNETEHYTNYGFCSSYCNNS